MERDPRQLLRDLVAGLRQHLQWLRDGGVQGVPLPARPVPPASIAPPRPPVRRAPPPAAPPSASPPPPRAAAVSSAPRPAPSPIAPEVRHADLPDPLPLHGQQGLDRIRDILGDCRRCKLCQGRSTLVFGQGAPEPPVLFVGEGPGAEEDRTGLAFVGAAGELLTRMIAAMGLSREQVYICNVVKCRPPGNRTPDPDEIGTCAPFLRAQVQALRPKIIVALGRTPAQYLLRTAAPITRIRGTFGSWEGIPVMPTFHPAYLLRTPSAKRQVWEDLKRVMAELKK